jgi:hypothetical protein
MVISCRTDAVQNRCSLKQMQFKTAAVQNSCSSKQLQFKTDAVQCGRSCDPDRSSRIFAPQ